MTDRAVERRYLTNPVEFRAAEQPGAIGTLQGYAAKYNKFSHNLGGFVERVRPGFFKKSLADKVDVRCRFQHQDDYLLGRTSSGTLVLRSDATGLLYTVDLPDTTHGRDVRVLTQRGDVTGSSFAFIATDEDITVSEMGFPVRELISGVLVDVAPVVEPAYPDTSVALRSLAHAINADVEDIQALIERNEVAQRLKKGTVVDLGSAVTPEERDVNVNVLVSVEKAECEHEDPMDNQDETDLVTEEQDSMPADAEKRDSDVEVEIEDRAWQIEAEARARALRLKELDF